MAASSEKSNRRRELENRLGEVALALREHCGPGNITVHLSEAGELVAILPVEEEEAKDLKELLGGCATP